MSAPRAHPTQHRHWKPRCQHPTARHGTVEADFRTLVDAAGIAPPDRVEYQARAVVFLWDGPRVAVVVNFDDVSTSPPVRPVRSRVARRPA